MTQYVNLGNYKGSVDAFKRKSTLKLVNDMIRGIRVDHRDVKYGYYNAAITIINRIYDQTTEILLSRINDSRIPNEERIECQQDIKYLASIHSNIKGLANARCSSCNGQGVTSCTACNGQGKKRCLTCGGTGTKRQVNSFVDRTRPCIPCDASGATTCVSCNGEGFRDCGSCGGDGYSFRMLQSM